MTNAPAPTTLLRPILAPLRMVAPIPIRLFSAMVQPCSTTACPIVQLAPTTSGKPMSVCSKQFSCTFEPSPISTHSLSPRSVEPYQILASRLSRTLPMTIAVSAIQYRLSPGRSGL